MEGVEGVEELHLRRLLAADELDIVNEQQIEVAVLLPKLLTRVVLDGGDDVVREILARYEADVELRMQLVHVVANGVEYMRFAEARTAVDVKGVVGGGGVVRNGYRSGVRETVRFARYECVERVLGLYAEEHALILCALYGNGNGGLRVLLYDKAHGIARAVGLVHALGDDIRIELAQRGKIQLVLSHQYKRVALYGNGPYVLDPSLEASRRHFLLQYGQRLCPYDLC